MIKKLKESAWKPYFDQLSKQPMASNLVKVEVGGLDIGEQEMNRWMLLEGLSYDPKDNIFLISAENFSHMVTNPVAIYVDEGGEGISSIEIIDGDRRKQIVLLKEQLKIPKEFIDEEEAVMT